MSARVHVLGAGLAGLAAALSLSAAKRPTVIHEAAGQAGGRCRSYHDPLLDRVIDNGNHLMMSANHGLRDFLAETGGGEGLGEIAPARFPFVDVGSGERWTLRPNRGPLPWWILSPSRRAAGTRARDYLEAGRLLTAGPAHTVAERLTADSVLWRRFWEPLSIAVLNCAPDEGAAQLLARVCRLTFAKGEAMSRPLYAKRNLAEALIEPALQKLQRRGVEIRFHQRVRGVERSAERAHALLLAGDRIELGEDAQIICALPSWSVAELLPGIEPPTGARMILNLHYRLPDAPDAPPVTGLTGSVAQWLFVKGDMASVTVSAADHMAATPAAALAARIWPEIAVALGRPGAPEPPCRVVKEKRATFHQTPANERLRPGPTSHWRNLFLAGDWTDTGLPATIEGAILSGRRAAQAALDR